MLNHTSPSSWLNLELKNHGKGISEKCLPRFVLQFCSVCHSLLSLVIGSRLRQILQPGPLWFGWGFFGLLFIFVGLVLVFSCSFFVFLFFPKLCRFRGKTFFILLTWSCLMPASLVYSVSAASEVWRIDVTLCLPSWIERG